METKCTIILKIYLENKALIRAHKFNTGSKKYLYIGRVSNRDKIKELSANSILALSHHFVKHYKTKLHNISKQKHRQ